MIEIICYNVIITFSLCYIIDVSGVVQKLNIALWQRVLGKNLPYNGFMIPVISCSVCSVWWACLLYNLIWSNIGFIPSVGVAAFCSYITFIPTFLMKRLRDWVLNN